MLAVKKIPADICKRENGLHFAPIDETEVISSPEPPRAA
jgi:hypothetical protein